MFPASTCPGRTGDRFMPLAKSGEISNCCQPNAMLTFKEYLYSVRMTYACKLLSYSDKSLLEVAMDAGFPDLRAFSQQFDRAYHTTPKEYRRQFRQA